MPRPLLPALLLVALAALAACDSGDAVDPPRPADVAGTYTLTQFRFQPEASGIAAVNLLDTLVAASSGVEILDSGDALFRYRLRGGTTRVLLGEVEVRRDEIRLTFEGGTETGRLSLLLPASLVFERTDDGLEAATQTRVNLEVYDPDRYGGLDDAAGTLRLDLTLTDAEA